jgi:hypothetical protein
VQCLARHWNELQAQIKGVQIPTTHPVQSDQELRRVATPSVEDFLALEKSARYPKVFLGEHPDESLHGALVTDYTFVLFVVNAASLFRMVH